ncbi:winged helix-turn-helix domain-containing protein [Desulfocurvus sp. DL9XJH121]
MQGRNTRMRIKIWLEQEGRMAFGPGCAMLLRAIENQGSLAAAVKGMGMSYRAAWGHIKKVEETLGLSLVAKEGGNRKGYSLTDEGRQLMEAYEKWLAAVEAESVRLADELFPWPVSG